MKPLHSNPLWAALLATFCGVAAAAPASLANDLPPELHAQHMAHRGMPGAMPIDPARMEEMHKKKAEKRAARQAQLKTDLKITPAQEPAWNTYLASTTPTVQKPMPAEEWARLNTPQRLDKMQTLKNERDAELARRTSAIKGLYAALTPEQQAVFDAQGLESFHRTGMKGMPRKHGTNHPDKGCEMGHPPGARS